MSRRHLWIDASAGVAGDMLLGALVDAGADLTAIQQAVDAVVPASVRLRASAVTRAGQRATKVDVEVLVADAPHRSWRAIRGLLGAAELAQVVRDRARATFAALAEAEAQVHGVDVDEIHFHEVGALDSIADVVGVCQALHLLGVATISASPIAVGSGRVRAEHGDIAVPVPAVVRLAQGWTVFAGGSGELTTPTGMALVAASAQRCEPLPSMTLAVSGSGAGTRDTAGWPNLTRALLGVRSGARTEPGPGEAATVLEANVDDLDPRLWPGVLDRLLEAGAADAWLVPITMKKGRPAHTLTVLCRPDQTAPLTAVVMSQTSTIGVRQHAVAKASLPRGWVDVAVADGTVAVKIAHRDGVITQAMPEFSDVAALAGHRGEPEAVILSQAQAAAVAAGLAPGRPVPQPLRNAPR